MALTLPKTAAGSASGPAAAGRIPAGQPPAETKAAGGAARTEVAGDDGLVNPVSLRELTAFTAQVALMLETGNALVESIEAMAQQMVNERFEAILRRIVVDVSGGRSLSRAIEAYPRVFNNYYRATLQAAENSGSLPQAFRRLEAQLKRREEFISNVRGALIYPCILLVLAMAAVSFLVTFVVPKFVVIFKNNNAELPLPTRLLLAVSGNLRAHWYVVPIALVAVAGGILWSMRNAGVRRLYSRFSLSIPVVGPLVQTIQTTQLLRIVGSLVLSGVPLLETLDVAQMACGNVLFQGLIRRLREGILRGETFTRALQESPLLPGTIKQMLGTGERTGNLGIVMTSIADNLDQTAEKQMKKLSTIFEPLIIVVMGSMIGFIAISIMLPLFNLTTVLRRHH